MATTLNEIDMMSADDPGRGDLVAQLITLARMHIEEEESQIFPALRSAMNPGELQDLGAALEAAKAGAPTRPHPHAPSGGIGAKVASAVSAPLDKARDKMADRP